MLAQSVRKERVIIKKKKKKKPVNKGIPSRFSRWDDFHFITIYLLATDGFTDRAIAQALGITSSTFTKWKSQRPAIKKALLCARSQTEDGTSSGGINVKEYIYRQLPDDLKKLWDEIMALEHEKHGVRKVELMLKGAGKRARQHLFLHAFLGSNFNVSEACRRVNISRHTFNAWSTKEPNFLILMEQMRDSMKDICMSSYMQLVQMGEPSIVLHSARTLNRDTFGNEKMDVDVSGEITHKVEHVVNISLLDLDEETELALLNAVRKQKAKAINAESKRIA